MESTPPHLRTAPTQLDLLALDVAPPANPPPSFADSGAAPSAQREAFLRERLLAKARVSQAQSLGHHMVAATEGLWQDLATGVRAKLLRSSATQRSLLIHMAAGASFTGPGDESALECLVLQGDVHLGPSHLRAGDYLCLPSVQAAQTWLSPSGAQLFLHSSVQGPAAAPFL